MRRGDRFTKRIPRDSLCKDKRAGRRIDLSKFVDAAWVVAQQKLQKNLCWWCFTFMNWVVRNRKNGLTCERLNNNEAHHKKNCVLACHRCNSRRLSRDRALLQKYFKLWYMKTFDVCFQIDDERRPSFM